MDIPKELYFIPILIRAFESADIRASMEAAFREIEELGTRPEYVDGYRQFEMFITAGIAYTDPEILDDVLTSLMYALATDTFEGPDEVKSFLKEKITNKPDLKSRYEKIVQKISIADEIPPISLELERDNEIIKTFEFSEEKREHRIPHIVPGLYRLSLSTGRVLWEGTITSQDVIWVKAFPGKNYTVAADTGDLEQNASRVEELLDGEVNLSIFPGLESGMLVITEIKT